MQRVGHHRGIHHVLDRHDLAQQRVRIVLGMVRGRHLDPGQLLAGGAVFKHVAHGRHAVHVDHRHAIGMLPGVVGLLRVVGSRQGALGPAFTAWATGQGDQGHIAFAGGNRLRCMGHVDRIRRTAGVGRVHMAQPQVEVVRDRQRPGAGRVGAAEEAIDIVLRQARIGQSAECDLGLQLGQRLVGGVARRVFVGTRDIGQGRTRHAKTLAARTGTPAASSTRRTWCWMRPACSAYPNTTSQPIQLPSGAGPSNWLTTIGPSDRRTATEL